MGQDDTACEAVQGCHQGGVQRPLEQMFRIRNAIGMGADSAIEHENVAVGATFPQVIVRTPVAEAQLEDRPRQATDQLDGVVEAVALGLQPAQEAVEAAQCVAFTCCS